MNADGLGPEAGTPLRAAQIAGWQVVLVAVAGCVSWSVGRGSATGIALGALLLHASLRASSVALRWTIGGGGRAGWAVAAFLAKLALLLGVAVVGLSTPWIAPMSLAVGATTLPVAIVLDTCYLAWANRRGARSVESPAETPRTTKPWNIR